MAFLDVALPILIIVFLGLAVWAVVSKEKVIDVIRDIWDFITEKKDEATEGASLGIYDR